MTRSRVYKNAPLMLAVAEFRHPQTDPLSRGDIAGLKQTLEKLTPLHNPETQMQFQVQMQPTGPQMVSSPNRIVNRFSARDKQSSITFATEAIVVECTNYRGWTWFKTLMEAAITARQKIAPVDGLDRIGLRFIDEIRVSTIAGATDWSEWVERDFLPPQFSTAELELSAEQQQALVQYGTPRAGETLTLRYGAVNGPPAVPSAPNLIRTNVPVPGPFFLIDTDAAWVPAPGESVPEMDSGTAMSITNRLHVSVKAVFESLVTEKLRVEVFESE